MATKIEESVKRPGQDPEPLPDLRGEPTGDGAGTASELDISLEVVWNGTVVARPQPVDGAPHARPNGHQPGRAPSSWPLSPFVSLSRPRCGASCTTGENLG